MDTSLSWVAIALATVSSMIVGTIWYRPGVFGRSYEQLTGVDPNKPKNRPLAYGGSFVASAGTAIVLAAAADLAARALGIGLLPAAVAAASALWLGFTAARMLVHELFEGRSLKMWAIGAGYELVTVLVMAVIIGLLGR